jgi:uroporphyrin-III C-methyltransferase
VTEEVIEKTTGSEDTLRAAPKSGGGIWIALVVLLTVILIAGASFYFYQMLRSQGEDISKETQQYGSLETRVNDLQNQIVALQKQLTDTTGTIANTDDRFEDKLLEHGKTQEEKLENARQELTTAVLQIQRQLGKTRGDWLLADAEYLLSVAGQRLHLVGDVETTREALEAADQRLRESGDVGAIKVREQIAKEIAALRAVPALDLVGLYAQLNSLSERVNALTLFLPYEGKPKVGKDEHDKHSTSSETSSNVLNAVLDTVDHYVTVRHTEQPIKAILSAEQAQFIRQQLGLKLEMIKVALIEKNQTLYHTSLTDALDWTEKNFSKNADTQRFLKELTQLDTIKLNAQMPDISLSLKMLRDISKLRVETDKALPAVELELKTEKPKAEAAQKPVHVETDVAKPLNAEKPASEPAPASVPESKKTGDSDAPAEKAAVKSESAPKSAEKAATAPLVTKPIVAH